MLLFSFFYISALSLSAALQPVENAALCAKLSLKFAKTSLKRFQS
jgi:hypothetical protein